MLIGKNGEHARLVLPKPATVSFLVAAAVLAGLFGSGGPTAIRDWFSSAVRPAGSGAGGYSIRIPFQAANFHEAGKLARLEVENRDGGEGSALNLTDPDGANEAGDELAGTLESGRSSKGQFDTAFADFRRSLDNSPIGPGNAAQFIGLNYSIESLRSPANAIEVRKVVQADGIRKGKVNLRIANDATILVNSGEVVSLFRDQISDKALASLEASSDSEKYVDFDTLRAAGIDVRYDAVHDMVLMNSRVS